MCTTYIHIYNSNSRDGSGYHNYILYHSKESRTSKRMFKITARTEEQLLEAAQTAKKQLQCWEKLLGLRIGMQRVLNHINKLPAFSYEEELGQVAGDQAEEVREETEDIEKMLNGILTSLVGALSQQQRGRAGTNDKRRKRAMTDWTEIQRVQDNLLEKRWRPVVEKVEASTKFGSKKVKDSLQVFNTSLWDQIESTLSNDTKVIEKSRPLLEESPRLEVRDLLSKNVPLDQCLLMPGVVCCRDVDDHQHQGPQDDNEEDHRSKQQKVYDAEVYDDGHFYSSLLRVSSVSIFTSLQSVAYPLVDI